MKRVNKFLIYKVTSIIERLSSIIDVKFVRVFFGVCLVFCLPVLVLGAILVVIQYFFLNFIENIVHKFVFRKDYKKLISKINF